MPASRSASTAIVWLRRGFAALVATYLTICFLVYAIQGSLLFHPTADVRDLAGADVLSGSVPIEVQNDGAVLRGLVVPGAGPAPRPTLLYFGGNAERVLGSAASRGWIADLGYNQVFVSYRGYDESTGEPAAAALLADGVAVYDAVARMPEVDATRMVAWGTSLGTGVATRVARMRDLAGVILAAPYARLSDIAGEAYPWLPVRWLFRHEIDTVENAAHAVAPVLVVHGSDDGLIPADDGRQVVAAWAGPSRFVEVAGASHNDLVRRPEFRQAVADFLLERGVAGR